MMQENLCCTELTVYQFENWNLVLKQYKYYDLNLKNIPMTTLMLFEVYNIDSRKTSFITMDINCICVETLQFSTSG